MSSTNLAQDLALSLFVVISAALLIWVAVRAVRGEDDRNAPSRWDPLGQIKKYPRYSMVILSVLLLAGIVSVVQVLLQILL